VMRCVTTGTAVGEEGAGERGDVCLPQTERCLRHVVHQLLCDINQSTR
jgi:hypothetical protein